MAVVQAVANRLIAPFRNSEQQLAGTAADRYAVGKVLEAVRFGDECTLRVVESEGDPDQSLQINR